MQISLRCEAIKLLQKGKAKDILQKQINWWTLDKITKDEYEKDETITINLCDITKANLYTLQEELKKLKDLSAKTLITLDTWIKNVENPKNAIVTSLQALDKMLSEAIKASNPKWIMKMNPDGMFVPYAVKEIKYHGRGRDYDDPIVKLKLAAIEISSGSRWDDDEKITMKLREETVYFYKDDVVKNAEDDEDFVSRIMGSSSDDEEDDEDETKPKRRKPAAKKAPKGDYRLSDILAAEKLMLITEENIKQYGEHHSQYSTISKEIGTVYTSKAMGFVIEDKKESRYSRWQFLTDEDKTSKLVVEVLRNKEAGGSISSDKWGNIPAPIHPYVFTYDLNKYCFAAVHVANIEKYSFDENIMDKLVISDKKKKFLTALISSKNNFSDIISGKSGGIIILGSGVAGIGKTLTAEVYAEVMKRPLYSIQSAQLGLSVEAIEANLNKALIRADRWNAVLLIDEADAYVHKRGEDILQNCIVGTFLRLLEYFQGIMFMTTNRHDIVDDAIMSRIAAHIKYQLPTPQEFVKLWQVLSENFGMSITSQTITSLQKMYNNMSGRDIRNLLKVLKKYNPTAKKIELKMIQEVEEFIPFLKKKSTSTK
jgi:AAA+ superfamily predicted ATPase